MNILKEEATYHKIFGSVGGILPNPDRVLSRTGKQHQAYRDLLEDPHVWCCVQSRKSGVYSSGFTYASDNAAAQAILESMDIPVFIEAVMDAILYGYQPIELVWEERDIGLVPRSVAKPQEWFAFAPDSPPIFAVGPDRGRPVDTDKFLIAVHQPSYMNPYGTALLSKCYWPVTFKNGGIRFWVTFMERYGMPLMLGKYERGSTQAEAEQLADALLGMTQDTVIVTPNDVSLSVVEPNRHSSVELYTRLVEHCNSEISKTILSQTLTTEIDNGSRAAAEIHFKIREEVVQSDLRFISRWFRELEKTIQRVNGIG